MASVKWPRIATITSFTFFCLFAFAISETQRLPVPPAGEVRSLAALALREVRSAHGHPVYERFEVVFENDIERPRKRFWERGVSEATGWAAHRGVVTVGRAPSAQALPGRVALCVNDIRHRKSLDSMEDHFSRWAASLEGRPVSLAREMEYFRDHLNARVFTRDGLRWEARAGAVSFILESRTENGVPERSTIAWREGSRFATIHIVLAERRLYQLPDWLIARFAPVADRSFPHRPWPHRN